MGNREQLTNNQVISQTLHRKYQTWAPNNLLQQQKHFVPHTVINGKRWGKGTITKDLFVNLEKMGFSQKLFFSILNGIQGV